jgi:hypothetical protein
VVTFPPFNFSSSPSPKTLSITLQANTGCAIDSVIHDDRDAHTAGGLTPSVLIGDTTWTPTTVRVSSGAKAWAAANRFTATDFVLVSDPFTVSAFSLLSFRHYVNTESGRDGGVVELSTDNGVSWQDAGPFMMQNTYTATLGTGSNLAGRKAFSGSTGEQFVQTLINLSSFSNQSIRIRFRMVSDNFSHVDGWYVDDILQQNGCGGFIKAGLYDGSNTRVDSSVVPVFVIPQTKPLITSIQFTVAKSGTGTLLNWQTKNEADTKEFWIEHSADNSKWAYIGTTNANGQGDGSYMFTHSQPLKGENHYRLKIVSRDQRVTYSEVQMVVWNEPTNNITFVPNPANQKTVMHLATTISSPEVSVYSANGSLIQHFKTNGLLSQITLNTERWAGGFYTVKVRSPDAAMTGKLLVVR